METKPKYLTIEFWTAMLSAAAVIAVTLGIASQEEAAQWEQMLIGLVAAVLPIVIVVLGYGEARRESIARGILTESSPAYMTAEFWMTLITTVAMVLVSLRVITQEEAGAWKELLGPLVAAVLTIAAYLRSRISVSSEARLMGLRG